MFHDRQRFRYKGVVKVSMAGERALLETSQTQRTKKNMMRYNRPDCGEKVNSDKRGDTKSA